MYNSINQYTASSKIHMHMIKHIKYTFDRIPHFQCPHPTDNSRCPPLLPSPPTHWSSSLRVLRSSSLSPFSSMISALRNWFCFLYASTDSCCMEVTMCTRWNILNMSTPSKWRSPLRTVWIPWVEEHLWDWGEWTIRERKEEEGGRGKGGGRCSGREGRCSGRVRR